MRERFLELSQWAADQLMNLRRYSAPVSKPRPMLVAHRGAEETARYRENTLAAFRCAQAVGVDAIEFDVHFSRDGVPVVQHDPDLHRIFGHVGVLERMTLAEIRSVTPDLPTLEEILALEKLHFMIEIKVPMTMAQLQSLTRVLVNKSPLGDYHLLTIAPGIVREHSQTPAAAWVLVGELKLASYVRLSTERGYAGVAGHYLGMNRRLIEALHERDQKAGVGFVPNDNLYHREWSRGVDWVFTNSLFRRQSEINFPASGTNV